MIANTPQESPDEINSNEIDWFMGKSSALSDCVT